MLRNDTGVKTVNLLSMAMIYDYGQQVVGLWIWQVHVVGSPESKKDFSDRRFEKKIR